MVNPKNKFKGKGDLILTDGRDLLVLEIKNIGRKTFFKERL